MRFRRKPLEVEAMQWTGENFDELNSFAERRLSFDEILSSAIMLDKNFTIFEGGWVLRDGDNQISCINDNESFLKIFERITIG